MKFFKKILQNKFWKKSCCRVQWNCLKLFDLKRINDSWMCLTIRPRSFSILMIILFQFMFTLKFSILHYKINNIRSTLNELMLIITELKNVYEKNENKVCLKYWKKMIFLTNAVLKSLSLFSFSKIIMNQEIWTFSAMIRENNKFFHIKIIKNYINMSIERLVNAFNEFIKKIKQINMTIFDINVYWNVISNTFVASSSTFKSFMLISDFATFRSFEKLDVDIRMRSHNAERFKQIIQQIFKKLNLERFRVESLSNQFMKNWRRKRWF